MEVYAKFWTLAPRSFTLLLITVLITISADADSNGPTQYSNRVLLHSSNILNLTLLSETDSTDEEKASSGKSKPWKIRGFQKTNISRLLKDHSTISLPPLNGSAFFVANGTPASLTLEIKNFSSLVLYLNFSYFVGSNEKVESSTVPTPTPTPFTTSQPLTSPTTTTTSEQPKSKFGESDHEKLATKLLSIATQITSVASQQQQTIATPVTPPGLLKDQKNTTPLLLPTVSLGATSDTNSVLAATVLMNLTTTINHTVESSTSNEPQKLATANPSSNMTQSKGEGENSSLHPDLSSAQSAVTSSPNPLPDSSLPQLFSSTTVVPPNTSTVPHDLIPIIHDMARKKRSVKTEELTKINDSISSTSTNSTSKVDKNHITSSPTQVANPQSSTSTSTTPNPSPGAPIAVISNSTNPLTPLSLPLSTAEAVDLLKTAAAVVVAAAASKTSASSIPGQGLPTSNPVPSLQKSTDAILSDSITGDASSAKTNLNHSEKSDMRNTHSHHDHHHKSSSKNSHLSTDSSASGSNYGKGRKSKKVENPERSEKIDHHEHDDDDDEPTRDSSSSSSSEELEGVNGKQKISYKTWRASLEKKNRPPGLYVTVNDDIVFDNWDGIWDKPHILGKWTGSKAFSTGWNQTQLFMSWEGVSTKHTVKIVFEWEPVSDNSFVILSDIETSTLTPFSCTSFESNGHIKELPKTVEEKPEFSKLEKDNSKTVVAVPQLSQTNALSTFPLIILRQNPVGSKQEWQVMKLGNTPLENLDFHEPQKVESQMAAVTDKDLDVGILERIFQSLPENVKDSLLLAVQKSLNKTNSNANTSGVSSNLVNEFPKPFGMISNSTSAITANSTALTTWNSTPGVEISTSPTVRSNDLKNMTTYHPNSHSFTTTQFGTSTTVATTNTTSKLQQMSTTNGPSPATSIAPFAPTTTHLATMTPTSPKISNTPFMTSTVVTSIAPPNDTKMFITSKPTSTASTMSTSSSPSEKSVAISTKRLNITKNLANLDLNISTSTSAQGLPTSLNPDNSSNIFTTTSRLRLLRGRSRPPRKSDHGNALFVCIGAGIIGVGILLFVIWKKIEITRKGLNAAR